jgi:flagellar assembly factor FliW
VSGLVIQTERFGVVEADEKEVVAFPGLPGFPRARHFVIRGHDRGDTFAWMICADEPGLAFVIANPWNLVRDYEPALPERALRALAAESAEDLQLVTFAVFAENGVSLNLAAPLLINPRTRRGLQVILESGEWPTRAPVSLAPDPPPSAPETLRAGS